MQKRKKLLFILLFIIASFATALHELSPHHHTESCQVCVVSEQTLSFDVVQPLKSDDIVYERLVEEFTCKLFNAAINPYKQSRAPPLFS